MSRIKADCIIPISLQKHLLVRCHPPVLLDWAPERELEDVLHMMFGFSWLSVSVFTEVVNTGWWLRVCALELDGCLCSFLAL